MLSPVADGRRLSTISKLVLSETLASGKNAVIRRHGSYSASWKRISPSLQHPSASPFRLESGGGEFQLHTGFYLNVLQSMGQAIHIMNTSDRLIYWNRPAENLYGYSATEALGKSIFELLVDFEHLELGSIIINRVKIGECWTGLFPVKSKMGNRFSIIVTDTLLYDEDGTVIGVICVAADSKAFEDMRFTLPHSWKSGSNVNSSPARTSVSTKLGLDPEQPFQDAIASRITDLANKVGNKVRSKMRNGKNIVECQVSSSDYGSKLIRYLREEGEGRASLHKMTSKAEVWISKKSINWPWKGNQQEPYEVRI